MYFTCFITHGAMMGQEYQRGSLVACHLAGMQKIRFLSSSCPLQIEIITLCVVLNGALSRLKYMVINSW